MTFMREHLERMMELAGNHKHTLANGGAGIAAVSVTSAVSWLGTVETGLRVVSLLVGISVGVITFVSIWRKMKRDK
jgi:hypothetical protein